ncbi:MAG: GspH/FimT family pseudopilin [Acidobacteriota bacterium]
MSLRSETGMTLMDMLVVVGFLGILMAIGIPLLNDVNDSLRLGQAQRDIERQLHTARQRAVATNRPMRVHFNCPEAGNYRMVELIGTPGVPAAADDASDRCSESRYPTQPDEDPMTRPNHDGPIRRIDPRVSFGVVESIEFWPDGTAHYDNGSDPWAQIPSTGRDLTLTYKSNTAVITVNGLGRITVQRQ